MDYAPNHRSRQPFERIDELSRRFDRAKIVQIVVAAAGKPHELLRLVRERKQALAKSDRNRWIACAMHDQQRRGDPRDALIGVKLDPASARRTGTNRNSERGDIRRRRIGRFQDQLSDRLLGRQRHRDAGAERKAPDDDPICAVARRREGIGRRGILQQPLLARLPARAGIAAIGQRDEAGAVGDELAKAADEAGQKIAIAVENRG